MPQSLLTNRQTYAGCKVPNIFLYFDTSRHQGSRDFRHADARPLISHHGINCLIASTAFNYPLDNRIRTHLNGGPYDRSYDMIHDRNCNALSS